MPLIWISSFDHIFVGHPTQLGKPHGSVAALLGEVEQVAGFRSRQTDLSQLFDREAQNRFRPNAVGFQAFLQPQTNRPSGPHRDLLRNDRLHQRSKAVALGLERDRADLLDDIGQDRIGGVEMPLDRSVFNHAVGPLLDLGINGERTFGSGGPRRPWNLAACESAELLA